MKVIFKVSGERPFCLCVKNKKTKQLWILDDDRNTATFWSKNGEDCRVGMTAWVDFEKKQGEKKDKRTKEPSEELKKIALEHGLEHIESDIFFCPICKQPKHFSCKKKGI